MPQKFTQKATTTFIKGLITEAGPLTFPPDASVDELNCSLERDGSRTRRLALEYETSHVISNHSYLANQKVRTLSWENVGGIAGREFVVVQVGSKVVFYDKSGVPLSSEAVPVSTTDSTVYELDLTTFERTGTLVGAAAAAIDVTSVNGTLVVVSSELNPFYIERDPTTEAFTATAINFRVRDFEWQGDRSTYDVEVSTASVSIGREYDTSNTGWIGTKGAAALVTYKAANTTNFPPLTHPWYSGKNSSGDFAEATWQQVYSGSTLIVNGHYILDLFNKDRDTASGLTGVTTTTEATRFNTCTTYANRVFYTGLASKLNSSKIYFSQLIETVDYIGDCYQANDPTSEQASDLLDTDGGIINLPDAHGINYLHVMGSNLLVFAENGVWSIGGVDDIFRATAFSVNKITDVGMVTPTSFVSAEGRPYWWSATGIHTIQSSELQTLGEQNISLGTIQTHWNSISSNGKSRVIGDYDAVNKQVFWFYPSLNETLTPKLNEVLVLDEVLGAFYPWTISDQAVDTNYMIGTSFFRGSNASLVTYNVVDDSGNQVVDASGNNVIIQQTETLFNSDSEIKVLVWDGVNGELTWAGFTGTGFLDWGNANYTSFAEAGYDFLGDMTLKKNAPFITVYMGVTETGWTGSEVLGYTRVRPSSLKVSAFWDFKTTSSSTAQQAYRLKTMPVVDPLNLGTFGYPDTNISTRLKVRGKGRSMKLRFESEQGKDFKLLGWEVVGARNPTP